MDVKECRLLIIGGESDPNTCRVVDQAHLRGIDYVFWDSDHSESRLMAWDFQRPVIDLGNQALRPSAIYLRQNVFGSDSRQSHAVFDLGESFALAWPEIKMLNRRTAGDANNKSRNLRIARQCGMAIPETIVIGDSSPLASHPDPDSTIVKPLAGGDHAYAIDRFLQESPYDAPLFVQQRLAGENIRVFSIGGELFAFHLRTDAVDYRTDGSVSVHAIDVPGEIATQTTQLVRELGFDYCALDFRCRHEFEQPVFLEVNSFPMFVAFDDACGNRLVDAVLEFLVGEIEGQGG
ncbi:RimK family alpha-L-glutamate ligase [Rhodopirellula sp. MGV]|uniref:ATP-grasp domain-containing protein n=1 Tax=Rhodopirellula sp. MGV TaxID=2023130 RepID=UPI000B971206|nr:hypothetical protein [Rhodopirellula sp. MGV]OYP37048.1 hypothetical protein CGZ80_06770 [Rhodopirellula sp. MGV]PNY36190.1 hypothetical protein C2E31_13815 [Rhodopirellula baltica]